ncbi:hypothetical protein BOTBODRAFT_642937 [Botryobasidium botryosum FD-172 SS1]|uniref:Uncharacterized protein n=1 Tax=Botryobasidium botryosum (strain FD-172 SS1) TaxID=930990 RepID=A0A067MBZ9_BOTB1|nr:hypothetical protein BOTBODRAFT_642937 [Botryobasidium botryosum FD-172 SS1]
MGSTHYLIRDDTRSSSPLEDVQPEVQVPVASSAPLHPAPESPAEMVSDSEPRISDSGIAEFTALRKKCGRFRVLVLGRANAGKTTLLKAVCGADGDPKILKEGDNSTSQSLLSPTAERGEHNINTPLVFPSNPGFIFHDSRGFEAGSDEELKTVKKFIRRKGGMRDMERQLHAIWYCIPTDNEARLLSGPEQELLRECSTGPVPLVVIFTKFDSLEAKAFHELKGTGLTRQQAQQRAPQHAMTEFQCHYLPHLFGETRCPKHMFLRKIQGKMAELIQLTVDAVDVDALKLLLVSVQKNNLELLIEYAVK